MEHSFYYKKIGTISNKLLELLKADAVSVNYNKFYDFNANVLSLSSSLSTVALAKVLVELRSIFNPSGHLYSHYSRMSPMTYLGEHSDTESTGPFGSTVHDWIKIQIPIITDSGAGMIWKPCTSVNFELGGIYVIDNVKVHASVNLSKNYRYYLTCRFGKNSVVDSTLFD